MEVSVIIPIYNAASTIERALYSVLHQKGSHTIEIIVIDDGSTDSGPEIVRRIMKRTSELRMIRQANKGVSHARNQGIMIASYEKIAFLDADDEWKDNHLIILEDLINKYPSCLAWASGYELRRSDGAVLYNKLHNIVDSDGILTEYFKIATLSAPPVWTSATIVRKDIVKALNGFTVGIRSGEDILLWARIAVAGEIALVKQITSIYNVDSDDWNHSKRRKLDYPDLVSKNLRKLADGTRYGSWRWRYLAHWHRMRGVVALHSGNHKVALVEGFKVLRYNILNLYGYIIIGLALIPTSLCRRIFKFRNNKKDIIYEDSSCT